MKPRTLIHLSGGLDSAYSLWQHLTQHPTDRVLVHHVKLQHTAEDRLKTESMAVNALIKELKDMGLTNFEFHESSFLYGTLPRISIKDIQIVSMFSAIILKTPKWKDINKIKLCWHKGEVNAEPRIRGYRVLKMLEALDAPTVELHFPIEHKTRAEMYNELPARLLRHVRSCRKPHLNAGRPCNKCKTCLEYINEGLKPL